MTEINSAKTAIWGGGCSEAFTSSSAVDESAAAVANGSVAVVQVLVSLIVAAVAAYFGLAILGMVLKGGRGGTGGKGCLLSAASGGLVARRPGAPSGLAPRLPKDQ